MNEIEISLAVSAEMDSMGEIFNDREIVDMKNESDGEQMLIYGIADDGVIIPFFKTMSKVNSDNDLPSIV
jgi:hypothetical protein